MSFNFLFKWSAEREGDNVDLMSIMTTNHLLNKFVGVFDKFDNLDEVIKYLRFNHEIKMLIQIEKLLRLQDLRNKKSNEACWDNWKDDREFARQQINGCRPRGVKRVDKELPTGFNVTDADISGNL